MLATITSHNVHKVRSIEQECLKPGVRSGLCNPSYWDGGILGWLMDREPPKGSKWPAKGLHYTWGSTRGGALTQVPPGVD